MGQIDLVSRNIDGSLNIEDHKFVGAKYSQVAVDQNDQATTYNYAYSIMHPEEKVAEVDFNCFVKTKVPKLDIIRTYRQKSDSVWLFKYFKEALTGIQSNIWMPRKSEKCFNCSFKEECLEIGNVKDDLRRDFRIIKEV